MSQLQELEQRVIDAERPFNPTLKSNDAHYYDLPHLIADSNTCLIVGEADKKIIATGYAQIRDSKAALVHDKHAYLGFMYVSPDHRRQGINQSLIEQLIQWSKSRRVSDIYLDVYAENESAVNAYRKAGFTPSLMEMKRSLK